MTNKDLISLVGTWATIGVLGSCFVLIFSPWMFHFLPLVSLAHSLLFAVLFIVIGCFLYLFSRVSKYLSVTFSILLPGTYLLYWFFSLSILTRLDSIQTYIFSFLLTAGLLYVGMLILRGCQTIKPLTPFGIWVLLICVITIKSTLIYSLPTSTLIAKQLPKKRLESVSSPKLSSEGVVYPFSIRVSNGIKRFNFLFPNISGKGKVFIILLDSFRYDFFDKQFKTESLTPTLNSIAEEGISFPQYRVQASYTKPSTASLFTGLYPNEHGVIFAGKDGPDYFEHVLPEKFHTLGERLEDKNYTNFGIVMSELISSRYNFNQGFETWLNPSDKYQNDIFSFDQMFFWLLHKNPKKSLIYLHLKGPHPPYKYALYNEGYWSKTEYLKNDNEFHPPGRFGLGINQTIEKILNRRITLKESEIEFLRHLYSAELNFIDEKILSSFKHSLGSLELFNQSLVVVTSDHGEELYEHGYFGHGGSLTGGGSLYEETIRVPLIMKFPGSLTTDLPAKTLYLESIDLTATIADFTHAGTKNFQGQSFLPLIKGNNQKASTEPFEESYSLHPIGKTFKYGGIVNYPWKLIHNYYTESSKLYNLRKDPKEENSIKDPIRKNTLRRQLFNVLGSDSVPESSSISLKEVTQKGRKKLKGLGYF